MKKLNSFLAICAATACMAACSMNAFQSRSGHHHGVMEGGKDCEKTRNIF